MVQKVRLAEATPITEGRHEWKNPRLLHVFQRSGVAEGLNAGVQLVERRLFLFQGFFDSLLHLLHLRRVERASVLHIEGNALQRYRVRFELQRIVYVILHSKRSTCEGKEGGRT